MPAGADAVLPAENTELDGAELFALDQVSSGKHVGQVGEDLRTGEVAAAAGRTLRPQDIGLLSSVGCSVVPVVRRPRVRILITGNEILPAGTRPEGYQIADANGPMLAALVSRDGGEPLMSDIIPDDPAAIRAALEQPADIIVVSGGSSVGQEDYVPTLLGRARRAGHPRRRHAPQQPDRHGPLARAACVPAAGQPRVVSLCLRLFRRPSDSRRRRTLARLALSSDSCPIDAEAGLHRRPPRLCPRQRLRATTPNRWPSAARRSSAPPRAPTAL